MLSANSSNPAETVVPSYAESTAPGTDEKSGNAAVDANSMATAAVDKSVVEVHAAGSTPMETSNSSEGATATTILSVDGAQGDDSGTETAGTNMVDGVLPIKRSAVNRNSRGKRYDDFDDIFTSADESEIDPLHFRGEKYGEIEKDAASGSNVLELDDDGDRWSKDFDRDSQSPSTREKGSVVLRVVAGILILAFLVGAVAVAVLFLRRLKGEVTYEFYFARSYGDHMVLQRAPSHVIVWGYGPVIDGNTTVAVTVTDDAGIRRESRALVKHSEAGSVWKVIMDPISEEGPFVITASLEGFPNYVIQLHDVMFGDVWVCVGQNKLHYSIDHLLNASGDAHTDLSYQNIRLFSLFQANADFLWYDLRGGVTLPWSVPKSMMTTANRTLHLGSHFPAICWLFGKQLHARLNRPIGLVSATFSDSLLEEWVPPEVIDTCRVKFTDSTSRIWNGMISPLLEMPMYGVVWHPGVLDMLKDARRNHSCVIPSLIRHWRQMGSKRTFGSTDPLFPLGIIQPAPRGNSEWESRVPGLHFANARWHQTANYGFLPNPAMPRTFLVVTTDLPDSVTNQSTHLSLQSRHKHDIVSRLILGAMSVAYGVPDVQFQGPWPTAYKFTADRSLMLFFSNSSLYVPNHTSYSGFEILLKKAIFERCQPPDTRPNRHLRPIYGAKSLFTICCSENVTQFCHNVQTISDTSEWLSAHISTVQAMPSAVTLSVSMTCPTTRYVVGVRYGWRETPCAAKQCPVYSSGPTQLPMPPYIRFGLIQDSARHELDRSPVELIS